MCQQKTIIETNNVPGTCLNGPYIPTQSGKDLQLHQCEHGMVPPPWNKLQQVMRTGTSTTSSTTRTKINPKRTRTNFVLHLRIFFNQMYEYPFYMSGTKYYVMYVYTW